eukprot:tig00000269_g23734.t1
MPSLESYEPLELRDSQVDAAFVEALGRLTGLRELAVRYHGGVPFDRAHVSAAARAFADALSVLPRLERLSLELDVYRLEVGDIVAILACSGARRALVDLYVSLDRPLTLAEAEGVLELSALERLDVACWLNAKPSLRPFQILQGLGPQVAVSMQVYPDEIDDRAFARAERAIERMFAGRRPARKREIFEIEVVDSVAAGLD